MNNNESSIASQGGNNNTYKQIHYYLLAGLLIIAFLIRLWGLGDISLHGDEETTTMPSVSILETGKPTFPSGLLYLRAVAQSYIIAASVEVFGESEWAVRFPSVIAAVISVFLLFLLGKHFMPPIFNLVHISCLIFNPWHIQWSQTARMYVFLAGSLILFFYLIQLWAVKEKNTYFFFACISFLIGLQFHKLAIFSSFLFFYPCILKHTKKRLQYGLFGFLFATVSFFLIRKVMAIPFNRMGERIIYTANTTVEKFNLYDQSFFPYFLISGILCFTFAMILRRYYEKNLINIVSVTGLFLSYFFMILMEYHIATLILFGSIVILLRAGIEWKRLFFYSAILIIFTVCLQVTFLYFFEGITSLRELLKTMIGHVSIYPYITFFSEFPLAIIVFLTLSVIPIKFYIDTGKIPQYLLLFLISVILPLIVIGLMRWNPHPRYLFQFLPFFILSCFALVANFDIYKLPKSIDKKKELIKTISIVIITISIVSPTTLWHLYTNRDSIYPDHKGAAEYVKTLKIDDNDIVLAEDILQQYYYGVKADYWLRGLNDARQFVVIRGDDLYDIYTSTKLIGRGSELEALILNKKRGNIYIITSGENYGSENWYLSDGIKEVFDKFRSKMQTLYIGKDNKTMVLNLPNSI